MNTKNNQRFRDTELRIQKTLLELLKTNPIQQITVRAICEKAAINRSTFYAHYLDVYDLREKTGKELVAGIADMFKGSENIISFFITQKYLAQMIAYIEDHKEFFDVFFNYSPPSATEIGFSLLWESAGHAFMEQTGLDDESEMLYHFTFFKAGLIAVLGQWLKDGCPETPEELAAIILRNLPEHLPDPN